MSGREKLLRVVVENQGIENVDRFTFLVNSLDNRRLLHQGNKIANHYGQECFYQDKTTFDTQFEFGVQSVAYTILHLKHCCYEFKNVTENITGLLYRKQYYIFVIYACINYTLSLIIASFNFRTLHSDHSCFSIPLPFIISTTLSLQEVIGLPFLLLFSGI